MNEFLIRYLVGLNRMDRWFGDGLRGILSSGPGGRYMAWSLLFTVLALLSSLIGGPVAMTGTYFGLAALPIVLPCVTAVIGMTYDYWTRVPEKKPEFAPFSKSSPHEDDGTPPDLRVENRLLDAGIDLSPVPSERIRDNYGETTRPVAGNHQGH